MTRTAVLDRWHKFADGWLTPIQNIKERSRAYRERLDADHPAWKAKYEANPGDYGAHDARREVFVSLQTILTNAQLCYVLVRDSLTDPAWWDKNVGAYSDSRAEQNLREYVLMAKWFAFHAAAMSAEETIRAVIRSAGPGTYSILPTAVSGAPFAGLVREALRAAGLSSLEEFFDIIRETRNTIHTNGIYTPPSGKPKSYEYRGQKLDFVPGRPLEWLTDEMVIALVSDLGDRMFEIVSTKPASDFQYCPRSAGALPPAHVADDAG